MVGKAQAQDTSLSFGTQAWGVLLGNSMDPSVFVCVLVFTKFKIGAIYFTG